MKTTSARITAVVALIALCPLLGRADAAAYAQIIKERDAVLSKIVAQQERGFETGVADETALLSARLALYSFRRDVAPSAAEKIKCQELIVQALDKRLAMIEASMKSGLGGPIDVLKATDASLQAKQTLEEMKMGEKKG